jgi:osmoprotectant transport system ATP-binding protein
MMSSMSEAAAVELRKVSKVYAGTLKAVDDVTLRIAPGRIVALLGPSGCGKTTTLRLINRLEEATSGEVLVRGLDVRRQRPEVLRRSIGYVIQEGGLLPHRNVSANVATVPRLLGWPRDRIRRRVAEVLELVGLPEK